MNVASLHASVALAWLGDGRRVAEGLLVATDGSSPLAPGASMLVDGDGAIEGSVSGGCVESAVAQEAMALLGGDGAARLRRYGISDELAGTVGLTCGGTVEILVHAVAGADADATAAALRARADGRPAALATVVDGPLAGARMALVDGAVVGSLTGRSRPSSVRDAAAPRDLAAAGAPADPGAAPLDADAVALLQHSLARDLHGMLAQGRGGMRRYGADGATLGREVRVFVAVDAPPPRLAIVGATDFSAALAPIARALGWAVSICDPRSAFARADRFARAADVVVAPPGPWVADQRLGPTDALLVFSHDPKHDEPAILAALAGEAGFIGALGSRRTATDRAARLRAAGATEEQLRRLHSPCGLDVGARTPEETAVSVLAEMIAFRAGRPGTPLRETAAPIHPR
jgi:xanthine dehydrogenase accessory factor